MRRLNLVLQELDRVSKEKEEIQGRLQQFAKESMNLQRMITGEDNIDKVNRYMQEDLAYEQDRNVKLKSSIKEQDNYKNDLLKELRGLEDEQDHQALSSQNISADLQKKISTIQDLEKEIYYTQEKIKQLNHAIEQGKRDELLDHQEKSDLQRVVNQLLYERNELLSKLDHLTMRYDECVREISQDRAEMERHNRQHSKLVTAKIIFQELEFILKNKYKQSLEEIKIYCSFDTKCHNKLQSFAKVLDVLGKHHQQIAIKKWFQSTLKPLEIKAQSNVLAINAAITTLLAKKFNQWRLKYLERINQYDLKTRAIQQIWQFRLQDARIEQKRALAVWKAIIQQRHLQKQRVKKLVWGKYFRMMNLAVNAWKNHANNVDSQIRLNVLAHKFTHKQYLNVMFHNFKYQTYDNKRKRLNTLFHYLKYWKDYINYKQFLMGAQVQALQFNRSIQHSLVKLCFATLKQNKEEERFAKVHYELNEMERPMIQDLSNGLQDMTESRKTKNQKQAGDCLCRMANKGIHMAFGKWKRIYLDNKNVPQTKIKGRLIKAYNDKTRMAFNRWKVLIQHAKLQTNEMIVTEQQDMQKELTEQVHSLKKDIHDKNDKQDQGGQRHLHKCVVSYQKKLIQLALGRWKDKMAEINVKEDGAGQIVKRLRCRMLRKGFDLYVAGTRYHRKIQLEEERCKFYNKTRNERLITTVFNQWRIYKNNFSKSKAYWYRLYQRLDKSLQQRGFTRWKEATKTKMQEELHAVENSIVDKIGELNHEIGEITNVEESQQQQLKQMKGYMTKQAQRVLSNTFAKYYYVGQTRGLERWKEFLTFEQNREKLIKRAIEHWRKHKFYFMKSCLRNWILNANITERKDQLKKEEVRLTDTENAFDKQEQLFAASKSKLTEELSQIQNLQVMYNGRLQKSIQMIVKKVDVNYYMSQKRSILLTWRNYVKREKQFITSIKNVISKSLWNYGFKQLHDYTRQDYKDENQETVLLKFRQKFWKRCCGNAMSVWKSGTFKTVFQDIEDTIQETNTKVQKYEEKVQKRKDINANRACRTIGKQHLRNLFSGWKNVTHHLKLQSTKKKVCDGNISIFQKKCAIHKWRSRKNATAVARMRVHRLKKKFEYLRKLLVFREMKHRFQASREFMARISNLANIHDHQAIKMGYNAIISFSRAKKYVQNKQKEISSQDIHSALKNIIQLRQTRYLAELKLRTMTKYKHEVYKGFTVLHNLSNKVRVYFLRWKESASLEDLAIEMHNEGPVREQIFEDRIELKNLQNFMKEEGYSPEDTQEALGQGKNKQHYLMLKSIRRFQHYNNELYTKPKMFDRWREYVQLRKLFRQQLRFCGNRGQYIKCDLAVAFDRWKKFNVLQKEALKKLSKQELDMRVLKNAEVLGGLADQVQEKENILKHLSDQRDELVENYIKGQKLALSLWQNNMMRAKHRAFMRWIKNVGALNKEAKDNDLKKNVELIAALKERMKQLEKENDDYSNENEELRQFSLDGYEIAKNVQALSQEREKLSVDLADKAQTIRKLLDENEKLNKKLKTAQDEAQGLIKSTTNNYMGGSQKSGGKPFQSPMIRNNVY